MFNLGLKANKQIDLFKNSMANYKEIGQMIDQLYKQVFNLNTNIQQEIQDLVSEIINKKNVIKRLRERNNNNK